MKWPLLYLLAGLGTATAAAVLTWLSRTLAPRLGLVDRPDVEAHKKHHRVVPAFGGPALLGAMILSFAVGIAATHYFDIAALRPHLAGMQAKLPQLALIGGGMTLLAAMGLVDDRRALRPAIKFGAQFIACATVAAWGPRITFFMESPWLTWGLTTFWLMFILNAVNFLDNMDGLAAGITAICSFFFLLVAAVQGQYFVSLFGAVVCGAACGFLVFNRPPATIFMGDSGSHVLGFALGMQGVMTAYYSTLRPTGIAEFAPALIPLMILAVPIFDLLAVVLIRARLGKPFWVGDNRHISHRFEQMGLKRPLAVLLVLALVAISGAGAVTLLWLPGGAAGLPVLQTLAVLAVISALQLYARKEF